MRDNGLGEFWLLLVVSRYKASIFGMFLVVGGSLCPRVFASCGGRARYHSPACHSCDLAYSRGSSSNLPMMWRPSIQGERTCSPSEVELAILCLLMVFGSVDGDILSNGMTPLKSSVRSSSCSICLSCS